MTKRRVAIVAHYDAHDRVADYFVHLVSALREVCNELWVVSTSRIEGADLARLTPFGEVLCRRNVGYDFFSWKVGLEAVRARHALEDIDEVVLCNDSVYGPFSPLEPVFERMEDRGCDLWGMTACRQIAYHLQSYFLVFRAAAIRSAFFQAFWDGVLILHDKNEIIHRYEIGLSQSAISHGMKLESVFRMDLGDTSRAIVRNSASVVRSRLTRLLGKSVGGGAPFGDSLLSARVNPTQALWDSLIDKGVPFVKIEILKKNPHGIDTAAVVEKVRRDTRFDVRMIHRHLEACRSSQPGERTSLDALPAKRCTGGKRRANRVSVIVPSYNHGCYIERCLRSIDEQDYPELEVIVIDDGSRDESWAKIEAFSWSVGRKVRTERIANSGAHAALNRGLRMATGEFVSICNSDDFFEPRRVSVLADQLSRSDSLLAFSRVRFFDDLERDVSLVLPFAKDLTEKQGQISSFPTVGYALLLSNVAISTGNFFFRRELVDRIGGFRPYRYCHDWDFILRSLLSSEPLYVPDALYTYRLHRSNSFLALQEAAGQECPELMRRYLKAAVTGRPENRRAPSPHHWPGFFQSFMEAYGYQRYLTDWEGIDEPYYREPVNG